jgi:hypothetical protein
MDETGLEPATSSMSTMRSNQLSYTSLQPINISQAKILCQDWLDVSIDDGIAQFQVGVPNLA